MELEDDGLPSRTDCLQVEHHTVVGRPRVPPRRERVRGHPVALLVRVRVKVRVRVGARVRVSVILRVRVRVRVRVRDRVRVRASG